MRVDYERLTMTVLLASEIGGNRMRKKCKYQPQSAFCTGHHVPFQT
jgi:hypothetical protein